MWISRAHFDLIAERAKDFREWHEQERDRWAARLADRDVTIAAQERQIQRLESGNSELLAQLFRQAESIRPIPPAFPDPDDKSWETLLRRETEELNAPDHD